MAADLTGLTPLRERSRQVLDQSFLPTGGVPAEELSREIQKQLWGTGESVGVYSQMARRGLNELQPETMYASSRTVQDSIQKLADQYAARQRAAIETGRTTEMTEPNFRLTEAGVTGDYGGRPTLENLLGNRALDIRGQEAATRSKQLEEELNWRKNLLLGSMAGGLAERSGFMDWVFGSQAGKAGGTGTGGVGGTAAQGVLSTAAKKAWDLITGAATSTPYLSTAPISAEALAVAQNLMAQGIPQNIAYEAANAAAVEGLSPAGESISNFLAGFSSAPAPAAGVAAGVGPAAPSVEAGITEMLGPELAAQLGYTAAPVAAGAIGAGTGALAGGVAGGMGGAAGAELGSMAAGSFAPALGAAGPVAAVLAPLAVYALFSSGVLGFGAGGQFGPAYSSAARSIQDKIASGYSPERLAREMVGGLPAMDVIAGADKIARQIGLDPTSLNRVSDYTNVRDRIAPKLAEIMIKEQRYPTQQEFLNITKQVSDDWRMANWQATVQGQQSEGKSTIDMTQPPRLWS